MKTVAEKRRSQVCVGLAMVAAVALGGRVDAAGRRPHSGYSSLGMIPIESAAVEQVNVNDASVEELAAVSGIGEQRALAIVEYRDQHGPFRSVEDLLYVPGIGALELSGFRDRVTVQ